MNELLGVNSAPRATKVLTVVGLVSVHDFMNWVANCDARPSSWLSRSTRAGKIWVRRVTAAVLVIVVSLAETLETFSGDED